MRIEDLAKLMGKTKFEIEEMLKTDEVIELNLNERKARRKMEDDELRIFE